MKKIHCLGMMRVGAIAVGVFACGGTAAVQADSLGSPFVAAGAAVATSDLGNIVLAAEANPGAERGPDQAAVAKLDSADPAAAARAIKCKSEWSSVDTNGDGVIDGAEIAVYNKIVRNDSQPVLLDTDRLPETDFITACTAVVAHE